MDTPTNGRKPLPAPEESPGLTLAARRALGLPDPPPPPEIFWPDLLASPPTAEIQEQAKKAIYIAAGQGVTALKQEAEQASKRAADEIERHMERLRKAEAEAARLIDSEETKAGLDALWVATVRKLAVRHGEEAYLPPLKSPKQEPLRLDLSELCQCLGIKSPGTSQTVAETIREIVDGEIAARVKAAQAHCGPEAEWPAVLQAIDECKAKEYAKTKKKLRDAEAFVSAGIARRFPHLFPGGISPKDAAKLIQRNRSYHRNKGK